MSRHALSCAISKAAEPPKFGAKARAEQRERLRQVRCDCRVGLQARIDRALELLDESGYYIDDYRSFGLDDAKAIRAALKGETE